MNLGYYMNDQQLRRWKNNRYKDGLAKRNEYKLIRVWKMRSISLI